MHQFPRLSSCYAKHQANYKVFFESTFVKYEKLLKINRSNDGKFSDGKDSSINIDYNSSKKQPPSSSNREEILSRNGESYSEEEYVHWKKKFWNKFKIEDVIDHYQDDKVESIIPSNTSDSTQDWNFDLFRLNHGKCYGLSASLDCPVCDESFVTRRLLNEHKSLAHLTPNFGNGNDKGLCYLMFFSEPKRFDKTKMANYHPHHQESQQFDCTLCRKWLGGMGKEKIEKYLDALKIKERTTDEGKRKDRKCKSMSRRVCELCSKILSNRKGLERHMLIHTGEKPFPCDICGKPFRRKDNCVRHKKTAHLFKKPRKPRRRRSQMATSSKAGSTN